MKTVSCIVSTFGRWWLLEEMIQSFLNQDYSGPKEMIVINDAPDVKLIFDHKDVAILNFTSEAPYNSHKRDLGVGLAKGYLAYTYDDDDIMLPHRIRTQVKHFDDDPELDYLQVNVAFYVNDNVISDVAKNFFFASHMWRRDRYISAVSDDPSEYDDTVMYRNLMKTCKNVKVINEDNYTFEDVVHMYKWAGNNTIHHSGISLDAGAAEPTWKQKVRSDRRWRTGEVVLKPHLCRDYMKMAEDFEKLEKK